MFCTSLRARRHWAPAVPFLMQHMKPRLRENKLDTHDVNMPLPGSRYLRFVLLSQADGDATYKHQRVERLYHQSGGKEAAVIWLLDDGGSPLSFMSFQIEMMDKFDIPIVPLRNIEELPATMHKFHRSFLQSENATRQNLTEAQLQGSGIGAIESLLPYCALMPPLSEHTVNLLTDLTMGFADLSNKTRHEAGRAEILEFLGDEEANRVIDFWTHEYLL